jgi:hypothetical protein
MDGTPRVVVAEGQPLPDGARQFVGLCSRYVEVRPVSFYSYVWVMYYNASK